MLKVAVFRAKNCDREFLSGANATAGHELHFLEPRLSEATAGLVDEFTAICAFVNGRT
jgi:D-lactate dehydrogenase